MITKTAQFTPGPWKAVPDKSRNMYTWYVEGAKGVVPTIARLSLIDACEEIESNARLIAAAPAMYREIMDLLDTIRHMQHYYNGPQLSQHDLQDIITKGVNVLAQAEGRHHE